MLFTFNFEKVSLVTSLLLILLVLVLKLDVVLHLVLDKLVLVSKGLLEQVDTVLLLVKIAIDPRVLLLVPPQLLFQ